jgi:hypothetical protein
MTCFPCDVLHRALHIDNVGDFVDVAAPVGRLFHGPEHFVMLKDGPTVLNVLYRKVLAVAVEMDFGLKH